ncbi:MAG TPA: M56 family metallopeptidase [Gemmatimonadales bacterium]|nr:M56 family metallopeptidase [Gemmatimonadales bacterium]
MIAILADAFVKATVLLLLAGAGSWALRRGPAALRHLVWALACGGLLVLPVASTLLPNLRVAGWPRFEAPIAFRVQQLPTQPVAAPVHEPVAPRRAAAEPSGRAVTSRIAQSAAAQSVRFTLTTDWTAWIVPVWLSGVAVVLILMAIGLARIWWLDRITALVDDETWYQLSDDLCRQIGLTRRIRLLRASGPAMPMTWGIRRPAILLPAEADAWPADRRRDVLLHELAHVKRHDFLVQLIARVACAVYWFHPLVWLAATRLREERERACDDQVLRSGAKPSAYATHLLELARGLRAAPATSLTSVAMARPAQLATRLIDVLDARRRRDTLSKGLALPAWIAAIAIVVPLAAIAPRAAEPAALRIDTIPMTPKPEVITRHTIKPQRAMRATTDSLRGCSGESTHTSSSTTENNENLIIFTNLGGCSIRLAATGKFTFTQDFTDIATVASGAQVKIEVDYGAHDRRVTIQRAADGSGLERIYKLDGDVKPFDADAKAWLSETLTFLLRRTGFKAEERARWILDTKGIQGLMDELGELSGDYTRRVYYQAAVESGKLDPAGYERLVTLAGQTIDSDYELAELLIAVAKAQPLTEQMQAGFVTAAKSINSDYERHRVLRAALSRPGLTPAVAASMLDAAADIASDYELAELLIELNVARPIDEAMRPAFFKAASTLESDYEHARVLAAVVKREGMTPAMLRDVLTSAKSIGSDYELAQLLSEIGGSYVLDDTLRPAFFAAANTIHSDYEHSRTLASVMARSDASRAVTLAVLESAKGIASDHELAELLLTVIQKVKLDDAIRAAIREDAQKIGSQYDRGRVFEALERKSGRAELD